MKGDFSIPPISVIPANSCSKLFEFTDGHNLTYSKVISLKGQQVRTVAHKNEQQLIKKDASYLISGGLGGLGLETAKWLVRKGARYLVLIGRRGPADIKAQEAIAEMLRSGKIVKIFKADVSESDQLAEIFDDIKVSMPPLKGIIHSAGVLDDGLISELNYEKFKNVMAPKAIGALNLHRQSLD